MTDRPARADIAIIGGGLLGTALAYHLAEAGSGSVTLLEAGHLASGATGRSAGLLSYQGWGPWDLALVRESAEAYRDLSESEGRGLYRENGGVRVARSEEGARWLRRVEAVLTQRGEESDWLDPAEVADLVPGSAAQELVAALHTPRDATFSPGEMAVSFARRAALAGAEIRTRQGEIRLERASKGWRLEAPGGGVEATQVVVAGGAQTKSLLRRIGVTLPMAPFRTQACVLRPAPLTREFPSWHDLDLDLYVRPAPEGRVLAGDGTETVESDPGEARAEADEGFASKIAGLVGELFPEGRSLTLERAWAGWCVASPDPFPLVGRVPGNEGLFVATGFNGFGAMRAPAIARRLAEAIHRGSWEALEPADPGRFPPDLPSFEPRPEFSVDGTGPAEGAAPIGTVPTGRRIARQEGPIPYRAVRTEGEVRRLAPLGLSEWFDPFLGLFADDALRTGGSVEVAEIEGAVRSLYLSSPSEGVASVFTRTREIAEHYLAAAGLRETYAEAPWIPGGERIEILAADLRDWSQGRPIRHPVRIAVPSDLGRIERFVGELTGRADTAWFQSLPRTEETGFVCELDGRVAGVSFASVVGRYGRGHSFLVHPRYRGLGIGTDLLQARMIWLRDQGVWQVVSEIYEGNAASSAAAERAGMAVVGTMYAFRGASPSGPEAVNRPTSGGPRTSGTPSLSSR